MWKITSVVLAILVGVVTFVVIARKFGDECTP